MKRLLFALVFTFLGTGWVHAATYQLDTQNSKIGWVGKKVTGHHNGTIQVKSGKLEVADQKVTGGEFIMDMTTIKNLDLQDPEKNLKLTTHLKSDDFFSVQSYPESTFKITSIKESGVNVVEVKGDLTIKGITHPITIPATVTWEGPQVKAQGKTKIDRTLWNIRYGSGKFFQSLGDKLIYDDFEIELNLVAIPVS